MPEPALEDVPAENESAAERWEKLIDELEKSGDLDDPAVTAAALEARGRTRLEAMTSAVEALVAASPMSQLAAAHEKTLASVKALFETAADESELDQLRERATRGDALAARALSVLAEFARKPTPAPHVQVYVPEQKTPDVHVQVDAPTINPPDVHVHPAQVTVAAAPTPIVEVRPEIRVEAAKAPDVHVAAPDVHVTVEQPPRRPNAVRLEVDDDGNKRFVVEDDEEGEQ